jgi:hypothetical protein
VAETAILTGFFSYLIFSLGLLGLLLPNTLKIVFFAYLFSLVFLLSKKSFFSKIKSVLTEEKIGKLGLVSFFFLLTAFLVNLIGAFGPELGFDSLWYHLTLPKIYLQEQRIFFIPGGLFYYSAMPKLGEMLYLASLTLAPSGILAKLIHYSFGILSAAVTFKIGKKYLKKDQALLASLVFYSTFVVGWLSGSAYIDLIRTFFEAVSLYLFLNWLERGKELDLVESGVVLGLAVSSKLIALASLPVFLIIIFLKSKNLTKALKFTLSVILVSFPWFLFSYINTGNPLYPVFSGILDQNHSIVWPNLSRMAKDFWQIFYKPDDLVSPVFLAFLPLVILNVLKEKRIKDLAIYFFLSLFFWYLTPRTGGARFLLPYLPALSVLIVFFSLREGKLVKKIFIFLVFASAFINIGSRIIANQKYLPFVLGRQTRQDFLEKNLNFSFGDYYDVDGVLGKIIKKDDRVLVYGGHNLFYLDFNFSHASYQQNPYLFDYILVIGENIPKEIIKFEMVAENPKTRSILFKPPSQGI